MAAQRNYERATVPTSYDMFGLGSLAEGYLRESESSAEDSDTSEKPDAAQGVPVLTDDEIAGLFECERLQLTHFLERRAKEVAVFWKAARKRGEERLPPRCDKFDFYRTPELRADHPVLTELARELLALEGSSIPTERLFSSGTITISKLRSRLGARTASTLLSSAKNALYFQQASGQEWCGSRLLKVKQAVNVD
mmetsp:Transcript_6808/g.21938  ORF Transcript_6808/g.21938 Transcript_6808/m.21938 type:complete len:195 (-) Transcript_6808:196-780(-)